MKNLIIVFFVLISFSSYAQYDSTRVLQVISSNGNDYLRSLKIRGGLIIPTDTPKIAYKDSGAIAYKQGSTYIWTGRYWSAITSQSLQDVTDVGSTTTNAMTVIKADDNIAISVNGTDTQTKIDMGNSVDNAGYMNFHNSSDIETIGFDGQSGNITAKNATLNNLASGASTDSIVTVDNSGVLKKININAFSVTDSASYHEVTPVGTNGFSLDKPNATKDTILFNIPAPIDTANKWVNTIYRTAGVDSIYYKIGSTVHAIKDSTGGGSGITSGTRATRIGLTPTAGQQFWQTDQAIGYYIYNGSSWDYRIDPNNVVNQTHFANNTLTGTPFVSAAAGSGSGITWPNPESGYNTLVSLNTGTTSTGVTIVYNNNGSSFNISTGVRYYSEYLCKIPTLSTSGERFIVRINQSQNWTTPSPGYWFQYCDTTNSGNWTIYTSNGTTVTTYNTGVAADANWHKYSIAYTSSTSVSFYIDDVLLTTVTTATTFSASPIILAITKTIGTTSRSVLCDKIIMSTF